MATHYVNVGTRSPQTEELLTGSGISGSTLAHGGAQVGSAMQSRNHSNRYLFLYIGTHPSYARDPRTCLGQLRHRMYGKASEQTATKQFQDYHSQTNSSAQCM